MVTRGALVALAVSAGCSYGARFPECEVTCSDSTGCPSGYSCATAEGLCRTTGATESCSSILGDAGRRLDADTGAGVDATVPFAPSNLGSVADDLHAGTKDVILTDATIDTDLGTITGVSVAPGDLRQQAQSAPPTIQVFRFRSVAINGTVNVIGSSALAIVATNTITVAGAGSLTFAGITNDCGSPVSSSGGGGGGGGGFGGVGAAGGDSSGGAGSAGAIAGNPELVPLRPGCSGNDGELGGVGSPGSGGLAGGSVQLVAGAAVTIDGNVCAPGGGGGTGGTNDNGGGGGASGGAILIEAPTVLIGSSAAVTANGGGGGTGGNNNVGGSGGMPGQLSCEVVSSGVIIVGPNNAAGGDGGGVDSAYQSVPSTPGASGVAIAGGGGGGGGGVGRIRINRAGGGGFLNMNFAPSVSSGGLSPP